MLLMPSLVLSPLLPSNVLFRNSWLRCSLLVNSSMTKPIAPGGPVNGMAEDLEHLLCRSPLESSLWRSWRCRYGRPISFWGTFSWLYWPRRCWSPSWTLFTPQCSVSWRAHLTQIIAHLHYSLAPSFQANPCASVLNQTKKATAMDCKLFHWVMYTLTNNHPDHQVYRRLPLYGVLTGSFDCPTWVDLILRPGISSYYYFSAALFRDRITFDCAICRNI